MRDQRSLETIAHPPVSWRSLESGPHDLDIAIFADGSGLAAAQCDTDDGPRYLPLSLHPRSSYSREDELPRLPVSPGGSRYSDRLHLDIETEPDLAAALQSWALCHPDPPEAFRSLILPSAKPFEWSDPETATMAQTTLVLAARLLDPAVREIVVHSNASPGMSHVQDRKYRDLLEIEVAEFDPMTPTDLTECRINGEAYAEISDSENPWASYLCEAPLAWLSRRVLAAHGRPEGWSLVRMSPSNAPLSLTRFSSISAMACSISIPVAGCLSNHLAIAPVAALEARLRTLDLLSQYRAVLGKCGYDLAGRKH